MKTRTSATRAVKWRLYVGKTLPALIGWVTFHSRSLVVTVVGVQFKVQLVLYWCKLAMVSVRLDGIKQGRAVFAEAVYPLALTELPCPRASAGGRVPEPDRLVADASVSPSGEEATALTTSLCPSSVRWCGPVAFAVPEEKGLAKK